MSCASHHPTHNYFECSAAMGHAGKAALTTRLYSGTYTPLLKTVDSARSSESNDACTSLSWGCVAASRSFSVASRRFNSFTMLQLDLKTKGECLTQAPLTQHSCKACFEKPAPRSPCSPGPGLILSLASHSWQHESILWIGRFVVPS